MTRQSIPGSFSARFGFAGSFGANRWRHARLNGRRMRDYSLRFGVPSACDSKYSGTPTSSSATTNKVRQPMYIVAW